MLTHRLPGVGPDLSSLVQGAMGLLNLDDAEALRVLDAAFEAGINVFDTATVYAYDNRSVDGVLGSWLASGVDRSRVAIMAKGAHPAAPNWETPRVNPAGVAEDIAITLERMNTDRLDVWSFHRDDPSVPVGELVDAVNAEIDAGRIDAWGVSNWTVARIGEAIDHAAATGGAGPVADSAHYSLVDQIESPWDDVVTLTGDTQADARAWHVERSVPVVAWSALAGGFLSAGVDRAELETATDGHLAEVARCYASESNWARRERAAEVADRLGMNLSQVAIAWLLGSDLASMAIVGGASVNEVRQNVTAAELELSTADREYLVG